MDKIVMLVISIVLLSVVGFVVAIDMESSNTLVDFEDVVLNELRNDLGNDYIFDGITVVDVNLTANTDDYLMFEGVVTLEYQSDTQDASIVIDFNESKDGSHTYILTTQSGTTIYKSHERSGIL